MTNIFNNDVNLVTPSYKTPSGQVKSESPEIFKVAKLIEITERLQQLLDTKDNARKSRISQLGN
jgi:hypothetical protein